MVEKDRGRIGILMGGISEEREISLRSGEAVYQALKEGGFEVISLDIDSDDLTEIVQKLKRSNIDVAFIALHGRFGEDGTIQRILEELNIPYTGSGVEASKLALDKAISHQKFLEYNLNVPDYVVLTKNNFDKDKIFLNKFKFPVVVKPAAQGSSIGLSIADSKKDLSEAIELAFRFNEKIIVEEYLRGRELTVGILDEQALPIIEIIPKRRFFDYEAKYTKGLTEYIVPAQLDKEVTIKVQNSALIAHKALGCFGFSRVDMILKGNTVYILEVNTIPGLTETSLLPKAARAAGIDFLTLCLKLIDLAYNKAKIISYKL